MPRREERSIGAFNGDTNGYTRRSPVRKERIRKSKRELEEEAAKVLEQAGRIECVVSSNRGEIIADGQLNKAPCIMITISLRAHLKSFIQVLPIFPVYY